MLVKLLTSAVSDLYLLVIANGFLQPKGAIMTTHQLSVLQHDYSELDAYINEVTAKGKTSLASKLKRKLDYLGKKLAEENLA